MHIGIDGNEANIDKRVGSNVYAYELLRCLAQEITNVQDISVTVYLKKYWQTLLPAATKRWKYTVFGPGFFWTQWRLPLQLYIQKYLTRSAPDLFFTPGHYAPRFSPIPSVISIMDLAFLQFPEDFKKRDLNKLTMWTEYSVKQAKHIVTISQATKEDVMSAYNVPAEKVTVVYPGLTPLPGRSEKDNSFQHIGAYFGFSKPYLIYIGTLQPRKNLVRLIEAYAQLKKLPQFSQLKLVMVGRKGWLFDTVFTKVEELQLQNEVVFTGFVSDYEKIELLKHAQALVLPSLYEGFGFPVLEAMAVGVPAIVSNVSSLPEVGGKAVQYIEEPKSVDSIAKSIKEVLQLTENQRLEMIAAGKRQAKQFTWDRAGKTIWNVLVQLQNK